MGELWRMGASDLADTIAAKEVSAREAVTAHLERIDAVNPRINAITAVLADQALAAAAAADDQFATSGVAGPLHGVPFTVKENIDLAGSATTEGVVALAEYVPAADAPHIGQARAAGAIPIGRTNMPDFGLRWHTENDLRGATRNPWDVGRTPGGSSGGEAAALATGMTPLGMGNDYGGSLRVPSAFCGTCALKPSYGRIAQHHTTSPVEPSISIQLMAVEGPMARHVRDLRRVFGVIAGPDARDPRYVPAPAAGPPLDTPIRVGVCADPGGAGTDADVMAGVRAAADALSDAGYAVVEEQPAVMEAYESWRTIVLGETRVALPMLDPFLGEGARGFLQRGLEPESEMDMMGYMMALGNLHGVRRAWSLYLARTPLVLGPVCTEQAFTLGQDQSDADAITAIIRSFRLTVGVNALGLPAAAVPVGIANGLPQGVQVIGAWYREDVCLDAAEAIEAKLGVLTPIDPKG